MGGKPTFAMSDCTQMGRASITLAMCLLPALFGCNKPDEPLVRLVKADDPHDCHLILNGVHIPDEVLVAEGMKHRGNRAVASDGSDRCKGALMRLRRTGMNIDEMPRMHM